MFEKRRELMLGAQLMHGTPMAHIHNSKQKQFKFSLRFGLKAYPVWSTKL